MVARKHAGWHRRSTISVPVAGPFSLQHNICASQALELHRHAAGITPAEQLCQAACIGGPLAEGRIVLRVRMDAEAAVEAVAQVEVGSDFGDVDDVDIGQSVVAQRLEIGRPHLPRRDGEAA